MATATRDLTDHQVQGCLLTIPQASSTLGVSVATLYRYMAMGNLPYEQVGRGRLIREADLLECKENRRTGFSTRARMQRRAAAHALHSLYDSREITQPARDAFLRRFEALVDPEGALSKRERTRRAVQAKKAYFTDLALRSSKARTKRSRRRR